MLHHVLHLPDSLRPGAPVLVLLHGRGSNENDLVGLGPRLMPGAAVIAPRGPWEGAPWGYGPGWAWYRYLGDDRPEPESFRASQQALAELIESLPALLRVAPGPVVVGGFSQGGTMSLAFATREGSGVAGALNFSGFLADHPDVSTGPGSLAGVRLFWGHGTEDPAIPFAMAVSGRERLAATGAALETRDYPIGHGISPEEIRDAAAWTQATVAAARSDDITS